MNAVKIVARAKGLSEAAVEIITRAKYHKRPSANFPKKSCSVFIHLQNVARMRSA